MKKLLLSVLTCLAFTVQIAARNGFAIVIDSVSYQEARPEVDAYARAIERLHGLKVYTVIDRWQVPDSIRATLKHLHEQKSEPIVGTVFVGDIPIVMVRDAQHLTSAFKMNQKNDRRESSVPSDRFYDDFGLQFEFQGKDEDKPNSKAQKPRKIGIFRGFLIPFLPDSFWSFSLFLTVCGLG